MAPLWILIFIVVHNVLSQSNELNLSNSPCYKPKLYNYRRSLRIVGGVDSERGETPYMVACMKNGAVVCGASIISERFLVLAAHCVCNNQNSVIRPTQLKIFIGTRRITDTLMVDDNHLNDDKTAINEVFIDKIIVHPKYSCGRNKENDIALLQLKKPIQFNEHIQPLCLSTDNSPNFLDIGRVSGWGLTHENFNVGIKPNILQTADVPVWENDECQNSYRELNKPHRITENQICAGGRDGGVDSCWMDSGGPLISKTNGNLIGIVSTGVGCARKGLPGIYTRMSKYTKWISSHVK